MKAGCRVPAALALAGLLLFSATPLRAAETEVERMEDAVISSAVKTALLHQLSFGFRIRTHDGVVTLSGIAADTTERDLDVKTAAGVSGVRRVINEMVIPAAVAGNN